MSTRRLLPKCLAFLVLGPLFLAPACTPEVREYGSGSSSSSSSSGGTQCVMNADCGADSECQAFTCADGTCMVVFAPEGMALSVQGMGDCLTNTCDGKGYVVRIAEPNDPTDDGNPCTKDICTGDTTTHEFEPSGTACNGAQYCDGMGACVECVDSAQCPSNICKLNACTTAECSDGVMNGLETDIDCGGMQCSQCPDGLGCVGDPDCKSNVCMGGKCAAPTCTDNALNGAETYVDCGGADCPPCATGKPCKIGTDCEGRVCLAGVCQDPACDDQVLNGTESDVDCGGTCAKCINGRYCNDFKDCLSGHCCPGDGVTPGYCEAMNQMCLAILRSEMPQ
ncbi:MAG TPA: hypothetical protein PK156_12840 [Polyangium sp.]|nr:hypothetical protein [Polyangium sp.]